MNLCLLVIVEKMFFLFLLKLENDLAALEISDSK